MSQLYPNGEVSLGLSTSVKSRKPPKSASTRERSGKPQTASSKRMVRNCIAKLEREHGKQNCAFATYTLPGLAEDELETLTQKSGAIAHRLTEEIGRDLKRSGIKPEIVWICEPQPERCKKTGVVAIHFHVVFQSRKNRYQPYAISKERNTEIWNRVVSNALGRKIEMPYAANIQTIKKSAENYMATYMTKNSKVAAGLEKQGESKVLPKNWWGATLTLRNWVKENTKSLSDSAKDFIKNNYNRFINNLKDSPFIWLHLHTINLQERSGEEIEIPVAILGKVRKDSMHLFEAKNLADVQMAWER